jgi:hypothetical protein
MERTETSRGPRLGFPALVIAGGILGAVVMAMYAMVAAATYQGTGFFTPMYHIASSIGWTDAADAMNGSMEAAKAGADFTFRAGPAILGMGLHLAVGIAWAVPFVLAARLIGRRQGAIGWAPAGLAFGMIVMEIMSFVVLPITARIFDSGPPIENMPEMVGWGTFTAEHLLYGFVLGGIVWASLRRSESRHETVADRLAPHRAA